MKRRAVFQIAMLAALCAAAPDAFAEDAEAFKDLATGTDYRVRVAAALALGKSSASGARPALEKALGDSHPAVRAAAAAGLGAIGDGGAIGALRKAMQAEGTPSVKAQMETSIKRLESGVTGPKALAAKPKFLISLGKLETKSGVKTLAASAQLRSSARVKMGQVPGIEVLAEGADPATLGKQRGLPAFTLDASLTRFAKVPQGGNVNVSARVELLIRKMPEQSLKGTITGAVETLVDAKVVAVEQVALIESEIVSQAFESAMKGATTALEAAVR